VRGAGGHGLNALVKPPGAAHASEGRVDGQLEALKWIALLAMLVDHVGRYALGASIHSYSFAFGRLAFPLFGYVLAINLARSGDRVARARRTSLRLIAWCALSMSPSAWARGDWLPVNVLGTLGIAAGMCGVMNASRSLGVRLVLLLSGLVAAQFCEFGLLGVGWVVAVFWRTVTPGSRAMATITAVLLGSMLSVLNAAFGGLPAAAVTLAGTAVLWVARWLPARVPRCKWFFYVFYPVHLIVIAAYRALA
jgi:TraX protein